MVRSTHWIFITANGHEIDFTGRNTGFPGFAFHRLSGPTRFVARSSPCSARASRTLEIQVDPNRWMGAEINQWAQGFAMTCFFFLSKLGYKKPHLSSKLVFSNGSDIMAAAAAILARPCARVSNFEAARFEPAIGWVGWYFLKFLCHKIGLFKRWWDAILTLMRW